jgi:hypothetical protein
MIEAVTPVETHIEPALRLGGLRCHNAPMSAQIEPIHR